MEIFSLFRKTLISFHQKNLDLSINLKNPILVKIEFSLNIIDYSENDINKRIENLIECLEAKSNGDLNISIFYMYTTVLLIDDLFKYYKNFTEMIIEASFKTLNDKQQLNNEEYWLTSWHPERVVNRREFYKSILKAEDNWKNESSTLREALFNCFYMPPLSFDSKYWDELKLKKPPRSSKSSDLETK